MDDYDSELHVSAVSFDYDEPISYGTIPEVSDEIM